MPNRLAPHPRVVDNNSGGISPERGVPAPHQAPSPGSRARKISPHNFWMQNQQGLSQWKKLLEPKADPLKEPTHGLTYSDSLLWALALGWQLEGHQWHAGGG